MITTAKRLKLRNEFKKDSGVDWLNSQDEPDLDYVEWLESKLLKRSDNSDYAKCRKEIMEYFDDHLVWKDCEVEGILKKHFA